MSKTIDTEVLDSMRHLQSLLESFAHSIGKLQLYSDLLRDETQLSETTLKTIGGFLDEGLRTAENEYLFARQIIEKNPVHIKDSDSSVLEKLKEDFGSKHENLKKSYLDWIKGTGLESIYKKILIEQGENEH